MVPRLSGPLKRPDQPGFMGPLAVVKVLDAATAICGVEIAQELARKSQFTRVPDLDEPVRETQVARLHQLVRATCPEQAHMILHKAGQDSADFVLNYRMPRKAQTLMARMPWPTAAWLLGRSLLQNSWTFAGSGLLSTPNRMEFKLYNSAFTKGETADCAVCTYHAALLGRLYQCLVHADLTCSETECSAQNGQTCHFQIHVRKGGSG